MGEYRRMDEASRLTAAEDLAILRKLARALARNPDSNDASRWAGQIADIWHARGHDIGRANLLGSSGRGAVEELVIAIERREVPERELGERAGNVVRSVPNPESIDGIAGLRPVHWALPEVPPDLPGLEQLLDAIRDPTSLPAKPGTDPRDHFTAISECLAKLGEAYPHEFAEGIQARGIQDDLLVTWAIHLMEVAT
jgi:hypothetical protein